jgi:disulfide oxidoreductase YuzD
MSSFANNQNFKNKITFRKRSDETQKATISIALSCNHDIDKDLVSYIDRHINDICKLFQVSYVDIEVEKKNEKARSEEEKIAEKLRKKEFKRLEEFKQRSGIV